MRVGELASFGEIDALEGFGKWQSVKRIIPPGHLPVPPGVRHGMKTTTWEDLKTLPPAKLPAYKVKHGARVVRWSDLRTLPPPATPAPPAVAHGVRVTKWDDLVHLPGAGHARVLPPQAMAMSGEEEVSIF